MSLLEFFKPKFNSPVDLSRAETIFAVAIVDSGRTGATYDRDITGWAVKDPRHDLYICRLDKELYAKSDVCRNTAKIVSAGELLSIGIDVSAVGDIPCKIGDAFTPQPTCDLSSDVLSEGDLPGGVLSLDVSSPDVPSEGLSTIVYFVTFLSEPIDIGLLAAETIPNLQSFYEFIRFADKYMLNMPYICSNFGYIFWLSAIREKQKDIWRANALLLTNIEQKYYTPKFESPAAVADAPAMVYPVGEVIVPKMVNIMEQSVSELILPEDLWDLFVTLNRHGCSSTTMKILVTLGASIQYCNTIICNKKVMSMRGLNIPQSLIFYAFRVMYLEELAMYNRKRGIGRFVIDIDNASTLPIFSGIDSTNSPYLCTVARGVTSEARSLLIPARFSGFRKVATLEQFVERFTVYTDGMLSGIQWSGKVSLEGVEYEYSAAFNGSGICACAIINPLETAFDTFEDYVEEYYPSRRSEKIHLKTEMSNDYETMYAFDSDNGSEDSDHEDNNHDNGTDRAVRAGTGQADTDKGNVDYDNATYDYADIDLMLECKFEAFDLAAAGIFEKIKSKFNVHMNRVDTENKYKYVITGGNRTIDLFHVDNIESVIVKYHLPCVRAWYDGTRVLTFPSFITAAMTGINMDIRWTSNRKDLRDTVLKYFQRGFATLLCGQDKTALLQYINSGNADIKKHSWPKHEYIDEGYRYRRNRFQKLPIFAKYSISMLFNPSVSRIGIHQSVKTIPQRAGLQQVFTGLKKPSKSDSPDYRLHGGKIELPFMCRSLGMYL